MTSLVQNRRWLIQRAAIAGICMVTLAVAAHAGGSADVASMKPSIARGLYGDAPRILDFNNGLGMAALAAGAVDGIRPGMRFVAVRQGRTVARLRVVDVREKVSGAVAEMITEGVRLTAEDRLVRELAAAK